MVMLKGGNNLKHGVVTPGGKVMVMKILHNADCDYSNRDHDEDDDGVSSAH